MTPRARPTYARRLAATWLTLTLALGATACSLLVNDSPERPRCVLKSASDDPCPKGHVCSAGYCVPESCKGGTEICSDNIDNDCDGQIDEVNVNAVDVCDGFDNNCDGRIDEGQDNDNDGNTWCGTGDISTRDCDEFNPAVHVGAVEVCDGYDNDCNGEVDDAKNGASLCEAGQECIGRCVTPSCATPGSSAACASDERCDADTGSCVPRDCSGNACPNGQYCDTEAGTCRDLSRGHGQACATDADCVSNSCIDAAAIGLEGVSPRVCGAACCNHADCDAGEVCLATGTGARSCLPAALMPTLSPPSTPCSKVDECDGSFCSARVLVGKGGNVAHVEAGFISTICTPSNDGKMAVGAICVSPSECSTGLCQLSPAVPGAGVCSTPCGTTADCSFFQKQTLGGLLTGTYCRTLPVTVDSKHTGFVPTCVLDRGGAGAGVLGTVCTSGEQCEDGVCAATRDGNRCAPACCNDSDCKSTGLTGHCRPLTFGDHYEMRCVL